jgi:hypothetical protein
LGQGGLEFSDEALSIRFHASMFTARRRFVQLTFDRRDQAIEATFEDEIMRASFHYGDGALLSYNAGNDYEWQILGAPT